MNRNHSGETHCEALLRRALTAAHLRFRQEAHVGGYHVDFLVAGRLCIEVDGYVHLSQQMAARDSAKTQRLEELGYVVMRLPNELAKCPRDLAAFVREVEAHVEAERRARAADPPSPTPFDTPALAALRQSLQAQEKAKAQAPPTDEELFLNAIKGMGSGRPDPNRRGTR